jgi:hypothetical protein
MITRACTRTVAHASVGVGGTMLWLGKKKKQIDVNHTREGRQDHVGNKCIRNV